MDNTSHASRVLATSITKEASKQTYYTIRTLVDRDLVPYAFMAYGYFRWVDDVLDEQGGLQQAKIAFIERQQALLETCYQGGSAGSLPGDLCPEEAILVDLVHHDPDPGSGLASYLNHMMAVMAFDARRRGRTISQAELGCYTQDLAVAVTEALHYFIGHDNPSPRTAYRYHAVTAAHITHMLRDAVEDAASGYFNVPDGYLQRHGISAADTGSLAYCKWVCSQVKLARRYFQRGRETIAQVKNLRCRLAGYAYTARFEWMLDAIERDHYCLRFEYPERKRLRASLRMAWSTLTSLVVSTWQWAQPGDLAEKPVRISKS